MSFTHAPVEAASTYKLEVVGTHLENQNETTTYLRSIQVTGNERRTKDGTLESASNPDEAYFTESDVQLIKANNGNCFEIHTIPLRYVMLYQDVFNTEYFEDWCDVWVEWATDNEMYIILNIQTFDYSSSWKIPNWFWSDGGYSQPTTYDEWSTVIRAFFDTDASNMDSVRTSFINAWKGIANRYKNNDYVLFNLINEPFMGINMVNDATRVHLGETYSEFMEDVIDGIHSTGAENIIIVNHPYVYIYNVQPINKDGFIWEDHGYMSYSYNYTEWEDNVDYHTYKYVNTFGKPLF